MQRHAGGGNAVRAIACLPALIGAWRDPAGGALLSSSGTYPVDTAALERPDLIRGTPRTINMTRDRRRAARRARPAGRARSTSTTRTRWRSRRDSAKVAAGFARDDLFCVVHEIFQTDTADYADILLPATTQLEQLDVHQLLRPPVRAGQQPGDRAAGRGEAQHRGVPPARRADGLRRRLLPRQRRGPRAPGVPRATTRARRASTGTTLKARRLRSGSRAGRATRRSPNGGFPTPSGKCEFYSRDARRAGPRSAARRSSRRASRSASNPTLARALSAGVHLAAGAQLPQLVVRQPAGVRRRGKDAAARPPSRRRRPRAASPTATAVRIRNDRGSFTATARVTDRARPGVVVAPSVWWKKLSPGRRERQRRDQPGADRPRPRRDVLRLPGRSRARVS